MSILSAPHFHNEAVAIARLEAILWPDGPHCPRCGGFDRITLVKGGRAGLRRCGPCKREFTVTVGTIFERSHVKLHKWFQAAHLLASSKKEISAHQLHRTLKVTYKTAWFMEHRLREAMRELQPTPLGGRGVTVEADETYVGGKDSNRHLNKRNHVPGWSGKEAVISLVERGGDVRSHHVASVNAKNIGKIIEEQLREKTTLYTDHSRVYRSMKPRLRPTATVNHSAGEYVRGDVHTNTIEGYFSIFKRGINGIYHHVSPQHLKRYLAEFDFRYNERSALGVDDETRADRLIRGIVGKRLMYRDSSAAENRGVL
jgi:transposase-like protein